jgi:ADP-heptose:LPS heptosyltransferase
LLHALRRHYPQAHITVACDPPGEPIASACEAVNEVFVLKRGWFALWKNARRLQNFDWVIAAKGGFDKRLMTLAWLTHAKVRAGFVRKPGETSLYTDPVAPPENPFDEHQIEMLLRLLKPFGMETVNKFAINLKLTLPEAARQFAADFLAPLIHARFMLINISSTAKLKFTDKDFIALTSKILASTDLYIGFVAAPADQERAAKLVAEIASDHVFAAPTPGPLDLAAILQKSACLFTPEGGAAHLAASMGTPALVLWSEGPFNKWHSRADNHVFIHAEKGEKSVPLERIWPALEPMLAQKK